MATPDQSRFAHGEPNRSRAGWRWLGDRWGKPVLLCQWPGTRKFAPPPERKPRVRWEHPLLPFEEGGGPKAA